MIVNKNNNINKANPEIVEPQLNFMLTTDDDDFRPVFISGNFNGWNTQDPNFMMEKIGDGLYHYKFAYDFLAVEPMLYKFTKGDWSEVEIDQYGNRTENRICTKTNGIHNEHVFKWRKNWLPFKTWVKSIYFAPTRPGQLLMESLQFQE